jgi:adenylate cyclase
MTPSESSSRRRLAAVWFADIAGFTRLASEDEDRAMKLVSVFQATARETVERYGGHVVKFLGDGALAEFDSTEAAARAALELRSAFADRSKSAGIASALRIGIHLGEVVAASDGNLSGDGVNAASRLQAEARPGQILASEDVWRLLRRRSEFRLERVGQRRLKGIGDPIEVFEIAPAAEGAAPPSGKRPRPGIRTFIRYPRRRRTALGGAVILALFAVLLTTWWVLDSSTGNRPDSGSEAEGTPAEPRSIAVLPFETFGTDPESEHFSDGIAIDIISQLSKVGDLRVISRTSTAQYEGTDKTAREIGRELGVATILEGSLRRDGNRVRLAAQLIDAGTDETLWSGAYDRELEDIFGIQSELAEEIAGALEATLTATDRERLARAPTEDLQAYQHYLRGRSLLLRHTESDTRSAVEAFEAALDRDPEYALAHAGLAMASAEMHLRFASGDEVKAWGERALAEGYRALEIDDGLAEAHEALAAVYRKTDFDWEQTITEGTRALELNPSLEAPHYYIASAFYHLGLLELADREVQAGMKINPLGDRVEPLRTRGIVALLGGRFADAVAFLEEVQDLSEKRISDAYLAQAYYYDGDPERAERMLQELRRSSSASAAARAQATLASSV